jgi:hypothetical protein
MKASVTYGHQTMSTGKKVRAESASLLDVLQQVTDPSHYPSPQSLVFCGWQEERSVPRRTTAHLVDYGPRLGTDLRRRSWTSL